MIIKHTWLLKRNWNIYLSNIYQYILVNTHLYKLNFTIRQVQSINSLYLISIKLQQQRNNTKVQLDHYHVNIYFPNVNVQYTIRCSLSNTWLQKFIDSVQCFYKERLNNHSCSLFLFIENLNEHSRINPIE